MTDLIRLIRKTIISHHQFAIAILIFLTCLFIYLSNQHHISSNDNVPNSLLAMNWLMNHSLTFDVFEGGRAYGPDGSCPGCIGGHPYFFTKSINEHLTSSYPIGPAIVTFPIYWFSFWYFKLVSFIQNLLTGIPIPLPDITEPSFNIIRLGLEKFAAAIATSLATVIFYLAVRLKFNTAIALVASFVYAFATNNWVISSQGIWQHSVSNLAVVSILLCLLKANRLTGKYQKLVLLTAGFFCGLLPGIRPTSLLFAVAFFLYVIWTYRKQAFYFLLGCSSILIAASWNFYYFGFDLKYLFVGGYSRFSEQSFVESYYSWTITQFWESFRGLIFSPSRGLLIYSPVVLFALPGIPKLWKRRFQADEQLLICLAIASFGVFAQYCFFKVWSGGSCFGPRFLTDILPAISYLIAYFLADCFEKIQSSRKALTTLSLSFFFLFLSISTFTQVVGAFGAANWDGIPRPDGQRLWQWHDTQIQRNFNSLVFQITHPIEKPRLHRRKSDGQILQVTDVSDRPITTIQATPSQEITLYAIVQNTGETQWFGYETSLGRGETRIQIRFLDQEDQEVETGRRNILFVSGRAKPEEITSAIGDILVPFTPGQYQMTLELYIQGGGTFTSTPPNGLISIPVEVSTSEAT